jgi:hypothetical protein
MSPVIDNKIVFTFPLLSTCLIKDDTTDMLQYIGNIDFFSSGSSVEISNIKINQLTSIYISNALAGEYSFFNDKNSAFLFHPYMGGSISFYNNDLNFKSVFVPSKKNITHEKFIFNNAGENNPLFFAINMSPGYESVNPDGSLNLGGNSGYSLIRPNLFRSDHTSYIYDTWSANYQQIIISFSVLVSMTLSLIPHI